MTKNDTAMKLLHLHVAEKGQAGVARELGVSKTTLSLLLSGKYGASTAKMEARVLTIYGQGGMVACPMQGGITPARCADCFGRAKAIGLRAGNPDTMRLYKSCLNCPVRGGR